LLLSSRLRIEGFIVTEHPEVWPEALGELAARVADGSLRYRESVAVGLAEAPAALLGLLAGANLGKQLVSLG
jgi:NADPH-dependent curcumin reductase CurA